MMAAIRVIPQPILPEPLLLLQIRALPETLAAAHDLQMQEAQPLRKVLRRAELVKTPLRMPVLKLENLAVTVMW